MLDQEEFCFIKCAESENAVMTETQTSIQTSFIVKGLLLHKSDFVRLARCETFNPSGLTGNLESSFFFRHINVSELHTSRSKSSRSYRLNIPTRHAA